MPFTGWDVARLVALSVPPKSPDALIRGGSFRAPPRASAGAMRSNMRFLLPEIRFQHGTRPLGPSGLGMQSASGTASQLSPGLVGRWTVRPRPTQRRRRRYCPQPGALAPEYAIGRVKPRRSLAPTIMPSCRLVHEQVLALPPTHSTM